MTKKKNNKIKLLILIIALLCVIGAGAYFLFGKDVMNSSKDDGKKTKENKKKEEEPQIQIVDAKSNKRPYAVMINNLWAARPYQSGLDKAYIVYEMIVEGGITRYLALFKDANVDRIGPIRSARHYYLDYALENDAIYVHHGQSPQAQNDFSSLGVDRISVAEGKTGWRDKSLNVSTEHTLFSSIEKLDSGLGSKRTTYNKDNGLLLNYSVKPIDIANMPNVIAANKVSIKYSNSTTSSYEYDAENKVYKRFVNDKAHTDYVTKEQLKFKNIITYQVKNTDINDGENKGRQTLHNIGSGTGYYITEGYAVPITWEKSSRSAKTVYKFEDGTPLKVNDGNTFIQIQPTGQKLTIE